MSLYFLIIDLSVILEFFLFSVNSSIVNFVILLDWISLIFISFVFFISSMVIYYSLEYIYGDNFINRFILLIVMFVLSIMFLILRPNFIRILLGWDGLGLVSYCLVIYYQNEKSYGAGMLTALRNRLGDVALLIRIGWMLNYGRWNFIYYIEFMKIDFAIMIILYLVVFAAFTKRAQIPFSSWLPAAIAAPTPVSSLVHSSTLVTAGVYLLIRFRGGFSTNLCRFFLLISCLTIFIAGLGANFEYDLKKIIALSTLSQLGVMISILFLGRSLLSFYHLLIHALFKALLFMCAGCIIHNLLNFQDIRYIGNLLRSIPLTCVFFNISNFSLCGLPFLSGFYSKDLILEVFSIGYSNLLIYVLFFLSTGLTVCYRFRLRYYRLIRKFNFLRFNNLMDSGFILLKRMTGLIFFVVFSGCIVSWLIFSIPRFIYLSFLMKMITLIVVILGIILGVEFSKFRLNYDLKRIRFYNYVFFFGKIWNLPVISTLWISYYPLNLRLSLYKFIDQGWSEFYGRQNIYEKLIKRRLNFHNLFLNNIKSFIYIIFFILMVLYLVYLNSLYLEHDIEDIREISYF